MSVQVCLYPSTQDPLFDGILGFFRPNSSYLNILEELFFSQGSQKIVTVTENRKVKNKLMNFFVKLSPLKRFFVAIKQKKNW